MKTFFRSVFGTVVAALLLLPTVALARSLPQLPRILRNTHTALALGIGFGGGVTFFAVVHRLAPAYVFSHELTHWLAAKVFRRRTGRFRVHGARGSVDVERPNIWITLSPYFVPLYSLLWLGLCGIFGLVADGSNVWLQRLAYAGVGVTYAFHLVLTFHCLGREQADLKRYGRLLSLSIILLFNVLILYLFAVAFSGAWGRGVRLPISNFIEQVKWCVSLFPLG